jgi:hypothetical protein
VHERKKETGDERLAVCSQYMEEQFVVRSRRLMEQIRALSDQLDAMDVANGCCCQLTPCFVDEYDVVTFSEGQSQHRNVWFDTRSLQWATLTVICKLQIYLPNPSYVEEEFVDESSKMMSLLMRSSNTEMFMKMLKILHKDS